MRGLLEEPNDGIALTLTTTGSSGASTYNPATGDLNIPIYSGGGGIDGTMVLNRIPYGFDADTLQTNANLTFNGTYLSTPTARFSTINPVSTSVLIGDLGSGSYILSDVGNSLFVVQENFNNLSYDGSTLDVTGKLKASNLTASTLLVSDASKNVISSSVTATEAGYLSGVTSAIQTQLGNKQPLDTQLTSLAALTYTGNALKVVRVNAGETDFELATIAAGGDVSKVGTPVNNQIGVWTGDGTIEGDANLTWDGTSLNIATAKNFQIAGATILADAAGTTTLSNIDALDATTESTIESAIDTLANLTSIQGRTVTLVDAGVNAIFGWDDVAGAYENLTQAEARTVLGLGTAAYVATDLADLNEATIEGAIDTLANLTSVQGLTIALADAGADALWGWDDSANQYANLSAADARTALGLGTLATQGDGDKGDISVSASGATWTIDNGVVTAAKTSITGTPDGTKYLRDDFTWQAVSGGSGLTHPQVMARLSVGF